MYNMHLYTRPQELYAKQRLELNDATKDAAQAGWKSVHLMNDMQLYARQHCCVPNSA